MWDWRRRSVRAVLGCVLMVIGHPSVSLAMGFGSLHPARATNKTTLSQRPGPPQRLIFAAQLETSGPRVATAGGVGDTGSHFLAIGLTDRC